MNILEQIKQSLGIGQTYGPTPTVRLETSELRQALDAGQRAKRGENYVAALDALSLAKRLAASSGDTSAIVIAALNEAEVYIAQKRWQEAGALLEKTLQTVKEMRQRPQMAYMYSALGTLSQAQDDWSGAQKYYEQALEMARGSRAVGAEGRAMGYLADVYLHDSNASYAIRLLRDVLPRLNMTGDIELSSYFVGRLGEALIASGQMVEGQQMLERALRLAKQMGYRREQRRWGIILGARAMSEGRAENAYEYYSEAFALITEDQQDSGYVEALCQMSKVCLSLQNNDEALDYAQKAVEASGSQNDEKVIAQARAALGSVRMVQKDYPGAIIELEAAVTVYARMPESGHSEESDILRSLGAAYAETGEQDKAAQSYQQAVKRAEEHGSRIEMAQTHRDFGLFYAQRREMQDAIREWQAALGIYEVERQNAQVARLYCDIAAARKYLGQGQRAMKDYEQALMLLSNLNEDWETRGLVLANAAIAYADQGDVDSADSFFNESIALARRLGNEATESTRRGNYGWFLLATGKPQQAISTLEYALRLSEKLGLKLQSAIQTDNIGLGFDAQADYPQALRMHEKALALVSLLGNAHWEAIISINLADTLISMREVDKAGALLQEALEQGRADDDVEVVVRSLIGQAHLAVQQQDFPKATPLLDEAIGLARRADMRRLLAEALGVYSEQQARLNDRERSATLWDEAQKLFNMLRSPQAKIQPAWLDKGS